MSTEKPDEPAAEETPAVAGAAEDGAVTGEDVSDGTHASTRKSDKTTDKSGGDDAAVDKKKRVKIVEKGQSSGKSKGDGKSGKDQKGKKKDKPGGGGDKQAGMRTSMERGMIVLPRLRDYKNKMVLNSYRIQPKDRFLTEVVRRKIEEILQANFAKFPVNPANTDDGHEDSIEPFLLQDAEYKPSVKNLVYRITEQISDSLVGMPSIDGYKLFINVCIAERNGQEQIVCSRHLWDKETDRVARVTFLRTNWYCCASVFALYQY